MATRLPQLLPPLARAQIDRRRYHIWTQKSLEMAVSVLCSKPSSVRQGSSSPLRRCFRTNALRYVDEYYLSLFVKSKVRIVIIPAVSFLDALLVCALMCVCVRVHEFIY